jgi:hypothetical protein
MSMKGVYVLNVLIYSHTKLRSIQEHILSHSIPRAHGDFSAASLLQLDPPGVGLGPVGRLNGADQESTSRSIYIT